MAKDNLCVVKGEARITSVTFGFPRESGHTLDFQIPASELEMKLPKGWRNRPKPLHSLPPEEAE